MDHLVKEAGLTRNTNSASSPRTSTVALPRLRGPVEAPPRTRLESTRKLGELMRDTYTRNPDRFRLFCPDETNSNRLGAVFEVSDRTFAERVTEEDVAISRDGRVMEVHGRPDADRFHVRGFVEEGTTTTPSDMVVRNRASRYHLVIDALERARRTPTGASELKAWCEQQLLQNERYVVEHLQDMPEVRDWSLGDWADKGWRHMPRPPHRTVP
jgi:phosphoketolase